MQDLLGGVLIKHNGRKIAIDSKRIQEAIERAAAALGLGVNDYFLKEEKQRVVYVSPKAGVSIISILSIIQTAFTIPLSEAICSVSITQLLKASGRSARSPPHHEIRLTLFIPIQRIKPYYVF
ncbi:hypothetical protein [Leclercia sp. UBA1284]|uniref:hypothetical protein n=1 Tax=Leclercia sp. UBA1284 TaxID=1946737 RepID=UPI00257BA664|nr:hypothetical protein [Leclercia sp. UBA1284]